MAGKDVSVGEYDPATGLTHITQQRGRLLFNMGASSKRQGRAPDAKAPKRAPPPTRTGTFTGLSLYSEEAYYLLQREALAIYLLSSSLDLQQLSAIEFTALLAADNRVSWPCVEVYSFLKDQKLHPRRSLEAAEESSDQSDGRRVPRHFQEGGACTIAFDVWKTATAINEPPDARTDSDEHAGAESTAPVVASPKKQKKRLIIVFRVLVCCYGDAAPRPRSLRQAIDAEKSGPDAPVKVAVVHHDQSVLLFEVAANVDEVR